MGQFNNIIIFVCACVLAFSLGANAQSQLPRAIVGTVSSSRMMIEAALGFYLPTNTSSGTNYSAGYQATSAYFNLNTLDMTAFCTGYELTSSSQRATLIKHTFSADNSSMKIDFLANITATPIACSNDSMCQQNNVFWRTQWPQYMLPNNASNPCAFCQIDICMGHIDVAANGTIITEPSVCPYAIQAFRALAENGTISSLSYPALPVEAAIAALYSAQAANATSLLDCQIAAETLFGAGGVVYSFDQSTNACMVAATCDGPVGRPAIYGFGSTPGTPYPAAIVNALLTTTSALGTITNLPNGTRQVCSTSRDCLASSAFTAAMDLYRNDSMNVLRGKPNTPNSALTVDDALDAICLNGHCVMIDVLNLYSNGPLGWNDTTMEAEFKCNYQLRDVVVDLTGNYDLNATMFDASRYLNPCTYYQTNVSVLEVYTPDCAGAVIFNATTGTYQLTVPPNLTVATTPVACHLAIRCNVNGTLFPYDCSGPADNTTYTTNVRGAMYDVFYVFNGVYAPIAPPVSPPALSNDAVVGIIFGCFGFVVVVVVIVVFVRASSRGAGRRRFGKY